VGFVSHRGHTFAIVGFAPTEKFAAHDATFRQVLASFGPLTDPAAKAVQPARVELVKVPREMTLEAFQAEFPSSAPLDVVATVNGVDPKGSLRAGQTAKRIVGGPPAQPAAAAR
jgi:predicted Zn-dependent protease